MPTSKSKSTGNKNPNVQRKPRVNRTYPFHGHWVTNPPFTLPAGIDHCPVPTCPWHDKTFEPVRFLIEHMKTRHGWPRGPGLQKSLDQHFGNKFVRIAHANNKRKKEQCDPTEHTEAEESQDDHSMLSSVASSSLSPPSPTPTGTTQAVTGDDGMAPVDQALAVAVTDIMKFMVTQSAPYNPKGTRDALMEAHIRACVSDLAVKVNSSAPSEMLLKRWKVVDGLHTILGSGYIQINTIMPAGKARTLRALFPALSARATFNRASTSMSLTDPATPLILPQQAPSAPVGYGRLTNQPIATASDSLGKESHKTPRITQHKRKRSVPITASEPNGSAVEVQPPQKKLKIILKMTSRD